MFSFVLGVALVVCVCLLVAGGLVVVGGLFDWRLEFVTAGVLCFCVVLFYGVDYLVVVV